MSSKLRTAYTLLAAIGTTLTTTTAASANECKRSGPSTVLVILDMDARTPGIQPRVVVPASTRIVEDVAVYIIDPTGRSCAFGVGFLGGIDRGIALGHMLDPANHGLMAGIIPTLGIPPVWALKPTSAGRH